VGLQTNRPSKSEVPSVKKGKEKIIGNVWNGRIWEAVHKDGGWWAWCVQQPTFHPHPIYRLYQQD
jgi:hypothetical protein